ncbi:MAG: type II toxin-antitoxin system prevent-host-death family antitoxin [Bryobacteraceae bacterium]
MKHRVITATEFKAKCLALLDEVDQHGGTITVTKRGRPVAELKRSKRTAWKNPANSWAGKVTIVGDIVNLDTSHLWNVVNGEYEP